MTYIDILFYIGRILYGGFFLFNGINHFMKTEALTGYAQSKGVQSPRLSVQLTGILLLIGGLGILLGIFVKWSILALVVFLLLVSFKIHNYWKVTDPQGKMMDQVQFMKNMALLGAALMMLSISEPWNYFGYQY